MLVAVTAAGHASESRIVSAQQPIWTTATLRDTSQSSGEPHGSSCADRLSALW